MQKKLWMAMTILFISTNNMAGTTPFNGLYGSVAVGLENLQVHDENSIVIEPIFFGSAQNNSPTVTDNSVMGSFAIGYSKTFRDLLLAGLEARVNIEDLKAHYDYNSTMTLPLIQSIAVHDTLTLDHDFALLLKLGMLLQPRTLAYGLIGPSWGNFRAHSHANVLVAGGFGLAPLPPDPVFDDSEKNYETGWIAGLGIEHSITPHFSVSLEYTHADYGNLYHTTETQTLDTIPGTATASDEMNAKTDAVTLRLSYYLDPYTPKLMKN